MTGGDGAAEDDSLPDESFAAVFSGLRGFGLSKEPVRVDSAAGFESCRNSLN